MRKTLLYTTAAVALFLVPLSAMAQSNTGTNVQQPTGGSQTSIDAGGLVGRNVIDAQGNTIGEIDSVMVDRQGKVQSVVLDVSDWLETEKLIAVPWRDLQVNAEGNVITSSLTKEQAGLANSYRYRNEAYRGGLLTESGERYTSTDTNVTSTQSGKATGTETGATTSQDTINTGATTGTKTETEPGTSDTLNGLTGNRVTNADGSLNMSRLIGLDVRNSQNENIGDVSEVILEQNGQIKGVVIDVGGFLGVGARPVFLSWNEIQLQQNEGDTVAMVTMSKDRIQNMPEYRGVPAQ